MTETSDKLMSCAVILSLIVALLTTGIKLERLKRKVRNANPEPKVTVESYLESRGLMVVKKEEYAKYLEWSKRND